MQAHHHHNPPTHHYPFPRRTMNNHFVQHLPTSNLLSSPPSTTLLRPQIQIQCPSYKPCRHQSTTPYCSANDGSNSDGALPPPQEGLGVKFRRRSSRRTRRQQQREDSSTIEAAAPAPRKEWDEMSLGEKAMELYVGEKGALFWLNKFAYASIFIIIGAWILFRFVGPALNLYQLDSAPMSPSSMFKG